MRCAPTSRSTRAPATASSSAARCSTSASTAEKMSSPFMLRVHGRSGHASMPGIADNALVEGGAARRAARGVLGRAAADPRGRRLPARTARRRAAAPEALDAARAIAPLAGELIEPLLGMTCAPTMAHASDKRNVIPALCEITVDMRLLPGQTPEEAEATIRAFLGAGDYELVNIERAGRHALADRRRRSGTRSQSFVEAEEPGAVAAPICVAGFTDSHWLRQAFGTVAYGFFPSRAMDSETAARLIHSADERVPVEDLELGVRWLRHAAQSVCG